MSSRRGVPPRQDARSAGGHLAYLSLNGPGDTVVHWRGQVSGVFLELLMHRNRVNKYRSAAKFRSHTRHTKVLNFKVGPMRGGIRL